MYIYLRTHANQLQGIVYSHRPQVVCGQLVEGVLLLHVEYGYLEKVRVHFVLKLRLMKTIYSFTKFLYRFILITKQ